MRGEIRLNRKAISLGLMRLAARVPVYSRAANVDLRTIAEDR